MKVNRKIFFELNNIEFTKENINRYNKGWSFSEIKKGEEIILKNYKENFNLQKNNFY